MEESGGGVLNNAIAIIAMLVTVASMWKVFAKAGEPGWAAIVPIYNSIVMMKIAGKPAWWIILLAVPIVNVVILFMVFNNLSKAFGGGTGFTLGLFFLTCLFMPILGFSDRHYKGVPAS